MKNRTIVAGFLVLAFVLFSSLVFAQHHGGYHSGWHGHSSVTFGFGYYGYPGWGWPYPHAYPYPYPYAYPYPYYSPPPVVSQEAPVYREPEQPYYWYYCENPKGYYPYITSCPGGWTKVVPDATPPKP